MPCPTLRPSAPSREGSDRRTRERMPRMRCGKPPFQRQQFPAPPSRSDVALRRRAKPPSPTPRASPSAQALGARRAAARPSQRRARPEARRCCETSRFWPRNRVLARKPSARSRRSVGDAKASTSVEIGGKTLPARTRTRFRGHKSPLLLHGATQKPPTATPPGIEASARGEKGQGRRRRAPSHRDRRMRQRRHIPTRARIRAIMTRAPDSAPRAEPLALAPLQERAK